MPPPDTAHAPPQLHNSPDAGPDAGPSKTIEALWEDRAALRDHGVEPTLNKRGCNYHIIGIPESMWLSSLPESPLPLLDAGACYGVQTLHALTNGRDVIAMDVCADHLAILRERVHATPAKGRLIRTVCAKLPDRSAIADASVAGILCSEVLHFLHVGEMRPVFMHFQRWLAPGGRLVVTLGGWAGGQRARSLEKSGFRFRNGRSADEAIALLDKLSPRELVDAAPGLALLQEGSKWRDKMGDFLYLLSTVELRELAEGAGLIVEEVRDYQSGKYGQTGELVTALLVARKPE